MDIVIPNLAESITEGDLSAWLKRDGEQVRKDDPILELETDKATVELAAEASGTLRILIQAGQFEEHRAIGNGEFVLERHG